MKNTYLFLIIALLTGGWAAGQSLSFEEALAQMQGGNQKLKGTQKQAEAADLGRKSYRGLYLPQLSINASYTHLADPIYIDANSYKAGVQQGLAGSLGV